MKKIKSGQIGHFIKARRKELKFSCKEFAAGVGLKGPAFISMIERGVAEFPIKGWATYADALQVPRQKFLLLVLKSLHPEMAPYISPQNLPNQKKCQKKLKVHKSAVKVDPASHPA
ncbi:MAG: helix-turn-helix transcriptional regulator [Syntrophobacter sp.]